MKYLLPFIVIFGCSVNLDVRFPKPNKDSCKADCEKYSYYTSVSWMGTDLEYVETLNQPFQAEMKTKILWKDNKDSYCICMDDCMGDDYDWEEECKRENWTPPTEQYEEFLAK